MASMSSSRMAPAPPPPDALQASQFPQPPSFHNLPFDHVAKPLHAMNMDELLRNVVPGGGSDALTEPSILPSAAFFPPNPNTDDTNALSRLSKNVDEMWEDMVRRDNFNNNNQQEQQQQQQQQQPRRQRQPTTLGETALEDFIVRAGLSHHHGDVLVDSDPQQLIAIHPMAAAEWLQFQMGQSTAVVQSDDRDQQHQQFHSSTADGSAGFENGAMENQLMHAMSMAMPAAAASGTSSDSQPCVEKKKKKRALGEVLEKTIERKQKRMIKNRESAARSRAKKQAYTNQLEHEVEQLKSRNRWLKKLKEVGNMISAITATKPKYQLRRTSSASF